MAFRENVARRFQAYGWHVIGPIQGDHLDEVDSAIRQAKTETDRPSLIICRTVIGHYSPIQGTAKAHSDPFTPEEIRETKRALGWPLHPTFRVPKAALAHFREAVARGQEAQREWDARFEAYSKEYPDLSRKFKAQIAGQLPSGWNEGIADLFPPGTEAMATRAASGKVLNILAKRVPGLTGGSADLAPSTKTIMLGYGNFGFQEHHGRNLHFGVREHAMGAIASGMSLHRGIIPYTATFLVFSDYMRPPMRLASMMKIRVVYIFTHDSIGLGQDGPTHQPIEQLMSLRSVPNLTLIRPSDPTETAEAWMAAVQNVHGPTALVLTRQKVPLIDRSKYAPAQGLKRGGYTLWESHKKPEVILIGTGSEVQLALSAGESLSKKDRYRVRVVSLPSWGMFDSQPEGYRENVLPSSVRARVSVEAGATLGWEHYVGLDGESVGIDHYGASAPGDVVFKKFGITSDHVASAAKRVVKRCGGRRER